MKANAKVLNLKASPSKAIKRLSKKGPLIKKVNIFFGLFQKKSVNVFWTLISYKNSIITAVSIRNIHLFRNLKYAHLTPIFRQHNIHLVSSNCQHKYK